MGEWLSFNLRNYMMQVYGAPRKTMFRVSCWYLWKWRNLEVFENRVIPIESCINIVKSMVVALNLAMIILNVLGGNLLNKQKILVGWSPPPLDWVAVNTYGAY